MKQEKTNKDELAKRYISDKAVFADLINLSLHQGKPIIKAHELSELDPITQSKRRDILKKWRKKNGIELILGIEIQSSIDPTMPIRVMEYDAILYKRLLELKRDEHNCNQLKGGEFLSGIKITDRIPCIHTLVLNLSGEIWNGAKSVKEIVNNPRQAIDYKMRLIEPYIFPEEKLLRCKSGVGKVLRILKVEQLHGNLEDCIMQEEFSTVDIQTAKMINGFTELKLNLKETGGVVNMRRSTEEFIRRWKQEGIEQGLSQGLTQGLEQGKEVEKNRIIKSMVESNIAEELILKCCQITKAELDALKIHPDFK